MLPTVGCEADATSFVEDKREYITLGTVSESVPQAEPPEAQQRTAVLHGTGTHYAAGPAYLPLTGKVLIECGALVAPGKRVRLRMPLRKWNEENEWVVEKLEVISEEYLGPYKGGRELPMSCGAEGGFSGDPAVPDETAATIQEAFAEWKSADTWCACCLLSHGSVTEGPSNADVYAQAVSMPVLRRFAWSQSRFLHRLPCTGLLAQGTTVCTAYGFCVNTRHSAHLYGGRLLMYTSL